MLMYLHGISIAAPAMAVASNQPYLTASMCLASLQIVLVAEEQLLRTQYSALSYEVKPFARSTSQGLLATALPDLSQVGAHSWQAALCCRP